MANRLEAKIKEIIQRTYNVKSFRLGVPDNIDFKAGQFLCATLKAGEAYALDKYFSISSSPTEKGYIEFTKKITQSDFSKALNSLKVGDSVIIQYPFGNFTLNDEHEKVAFLSGGIGITPVRSICKYVVDKRLGTDMVLLYANRSIRDVVFKEDFDLMQEDYPKLKVAHVLCEPATGFECIVGLINAQVIKDEIPDYAQRKFFICGPPAMVETMQRMLTEELLLSKENIITERFAGY